jgi:hypothetical protein
MKQIGIDQPVALPQSNFKAQIPLLVGNLLILSLSAYLSLQTIAPPDRVAADAPVTEFSSERAMETLKNIAQKPRPIGSSEHDSVRDYLMRRITEMGLRPELQQARAIRSRRNGVYVGADVENILVRLPGLKNRKSVLLAAHYDSVAAGPGAADNGSAVSALIETLRALRAGSPMSNDILILFTDAEEAGLLGSQAFINQYPYLKEIGVALNFEARGAAGAALMFETSAGNFPLIREFSRGAPLAIGNSLSREIYRLLPNDTDMTLFRAAGLNGLNFAYIQAVNRYHTRWDSVASLDERSLQHQGSSALALARHFGGLDYEIHPAADAVYFNLPGSHFVYYSSSWSKPLALAAALWFGVVTVLGFRRRRLAWSGILRGFVGSPLAMIAAAVIVGAMWWVIGRASSFNSIEPVDPPNADLFLIGFSLISLAVAGSICVWLGKKSDWPSMALGALAWWLIAALVSALFAPGGSYLFLWPLASSLLGLFAAQAVGEYWSRSWLGSLLLSISATVGILLFLPMIYLIFLAMGLRVCVALAILVVWLASLFLPLFLLIDARRRWAAPSAAALIGAGFIITALSLASLSGDQQRRNSVFYAMNADKGEAVWASYDRGPDAWTSQFFGADATRGPLDGYLVSGFRRFMQAAAPLAPLRGPELTLIDSSIENGVRSLKIHVQSPRQAPAIMLTLDGDATVQNFAVDDQQVAHEKSRPWELTYYTLPESGIDLVLRVKSTAPIRLRAADMSYGLFGNEQTPFSPRPENMAASTLLFNDMTIVVKSFEF